MSQRRIVFVALATQAGLILLSWWASRVVELPPSWGEHLPRDVAIGVAVAALLGAINFVLLTRAPENWLVTGVRTVYHETVVPLFGRLGPLSAWAIAAAAGLGEEWLFRGVVQPLVGVVAASVLFGMAHVGNKRMLPFGVWATGMGFVMGGLVIATGALTASVVAHAVYDMLALEYIRRSDDPHRRPARSGADLV